MWGLLMLIPINLDYASMRVKSQVGYTNPTVKQLEAFESKVEPKSHIAGWPL